MSIRDAVLTSLAIYIEQRRASAQVPSDVFEFNRQSEFGDDLFEIAKIGNAESGSFRALVEVRAR
jgi:hypothetical protein